MKDNMKNNILMQLKRTNTPLYFNNLMPLVSFYTPGFLMFSEGIERNKWHEMC